MDLISIHMVIMMMMILGVQLINMYLSLCVCSEVQFRQVAGDVERFQGKWAIQEVVGDVQEDYAGPQTLLKYAVEIIIPTEASMCGFIEPLLEGMVFEDMPNNLMAIKHEVERRRVEQDGRVIVPTRQRPKLGGTLQC
jgi:hypothetical protein